MPVVTVDVANYERHELKSAPANPAVPGDENGYVMLRPLPYGMKLTRRDKASKLMMKAQPTQKGGRTQAPELETTIESYSEWAVAFDFAYCVGEHNLTDTNGVLVDFSKPMSLKLLNPRVGSEIEKLINSLNEDLEGDDLEDFLRQLNTSPTDEPIRLAPNGSEPLETPTVTPLETPTET